MRWAARDGPLAHASTGVWIWQAGLRVGTWALDTPRMGEGRRPQSRRTIPAGPRNGEIRGGSAIRGPYMGRSGCRLRGAHRHSPSGRVSNPPQNLPAPALPSLVVVGAKHARPRSGRPARHGHASPLPDTRRLSLSGPHHLENVGARHAVPSPWAQRTSAAVATRGVRGICIRPSVRARQVAAGFSLRQTPAIAIRPRPAAVHGGCVSDKEICWDGDRRGEACFAPTPSGRRFRTRMDVA